MKEQVLEEEKKRVGEEEAEIRMNNYCPDITVTDATPISELQSLK